MASKRGAGGWKGSRKGSAASAKRAVPGPVRPSPSSLEGKIAVITGASRGIGLALAQLLAKAGCSLALTARNTSTLRDFAQRTGARGDVLIEPCDVRDQNSVARFFDAVHGRLKRVDFLINNAGAAHGLAPIDQLDPDLWRNAINTNLNGTFLCCHYCLPLMPRGGAIVNNLSVAAQGHFPGHSGYNAAKWGALGLTNTMREELRDRGIRVIAFLPGPTDTDIWDQFWPDRPREKMMTPASVAQAVVDCLSLPENSVVEEIRLRPIGGNL
jgi:NAD(P)-dependent dehydrogenase (short-subunit alcohol dehydrogenase family)